MMRSVLGAAIACGLAAVAMAIAPAPGDGPAVALAGWPHLLLYILAGGILGATAPGLAVARICPRGASWRALALVGAGIAASLVVTTVNVVRLNRDIADPWGPPLWLLSMGLLILYVALPLARDIGWESVWTPEPLPPHQRRVALALFAVIVLVAAAARVIALRELPAGINADEGDRSASAFDALSGRGPAGWFNSGWFYINMVYFRLLAVSLTIFGPDIFGGRMFSAISGIGLVIAVGWFAVRSFGWRVGLLAMAFAAGTEMSLQHSRFVSETGPTALLWAISIGCLLEGTRTGRLWYWAVAGLCGGLCLYFYPSARLWGVGAAVTVVALVLQRRDLRLVPGAAMAGVAALIAAAPFLVHLSKTPFEITGRYAQTTVFDPNNQVRLGYLSPPEPLPHLLALQAERTLGMFDRYPDGGGFMPRPNGGTVFNPPLAALTLVGAFACLARAWRDPRLLVISIWFWLGISGVLVTVETPDYIRAVGMLPSLFVILAVTLVDLLDRFLAVIPRGLLAFRGQAYAAPALVGALLVGQEMTSYFTTYSTLPPAWGPATREGQDVARLGATGPVYGLEMNEHAVISGWVRLLAPHAARGRIPNPGRELPLLDVGLAADQMATLRPDVVPGQGQGLSILIAPDPHQAAYLAWLEELYPGFTLDAAGDGRQAFGVSAHALAETQGAEVSVDDAPPVAVSRLGEVPANVRLPARLRWSTGFRIVRPGTYTLRTSAPADVRVDGVSVGDSLIAVPGLHFVEMSATVQPGTNVIEPTLVAPDGLTRHLAGPETYRLMDAPWGLQVRTTLPGGAAGESRLDATVAMAFFDPELRPATPPERVVWSGTLLAPLTGAYRMAFAGEDHLSLEVDGGQANVASLTPEQWPRAGMGSIVQLSAGPHAITIALDVTHGGRELARWSWVPPLADGSVDATTAWSVVPPRVLRPTATLR